MVLTQTATPLHLGHGKLLVAYRRKDKAGLWLARVHLTPDTDEWITDQQAPIWGAEEGSATTASSAGEVTDLDNLQAKTAGLGFGLPTLVRIDAKSVMLAVWCEEAGITNIRYFHIELCSDDM